MDRSKFLLEVIEKYVKKDWTILEVGCGDNRNVDYLTSHGYLVSGIDKKLGTAIEDVPFVEYDVIFTMSTLFLISDESVFEKMAKMAQKLLITIEGETSKPGIGVIGRDYNDVFSRLGFIQVEHQENVFNVFGHLRVFKKI